MKRISILFSSLSVVAILGACAPASQIISRADTTPLSFQNAPTLNSVEEQAFALSQMADQLVVHSTVQEPTNGALFSCGLASIWGGTRSCSVGPDSGGLLSRTFGRRDTAAGQEILSADTLVQSIRDMNGQMSELQLSLPDLIAQQDAELADATVRRDVGALSQVEYEQRLFAISENRARISHALTLTEEQSKQANYNMQSAGTLGQDGLDWHLSATAQLAREASAARSLIAPLQMPISSEFESEVLAAPIVVEAPIEPIAVSVETDVIWTPSAETALADLPRSGVLR